MLRNNRKREVRKKRIHSFPTRRSSSEERRVGKECTPRSSDLKTVAWEAPAIGALIKETVGKHGLKMPKLAMPLRVLLTGQAQTPSVDAVVALFPRETVLARLQRGLG